MKPTKEVTNEDEGHEGDERASGNASSVLSVAAGAAPSVGFGGSVASGSGSGNPRVSLKQAAYLASQPPGLRPPGSQAPSAQTDLLLLFATWPAGRWAVWPGK